MTATHNVQAGRAELRATIDARMKIDVRMNDGAWFTLTNDELCVLIRPADVVDAWKRRMHTALEAAPAWHNGSAVLDVWTLYATPQQTCATWQANISDRPLRTVCVAYGQCDIIGPHHVYHGERNKPQALADARVAAVEAARAWVDEAAAALLVAL